MTVHGCLKDTVIELLLLFVLLFLPHWLWSFYLFLFTLSLLAIRLPCFNKLQLSWGYFIHCDSEYDTDQTAVGTVHMPVNDYLVPLVTCTLTAAIVCLYTMLIRYCLLNTIIVIIIECMRFYVVQPCIAL